MASEFTKIIKNWNYRVGFDGEEYRIIECFYDENNELLAWAEADSEMSDTAEGVALEAQRRINATLKPLVDLRNFPKEV
jgi:hypothetical protein